MSFRRPAHNPDQNPATSLPLGGDLCMQAGLANGSPRRLPRLMGFASTHPACSGHPLLFPSATLQCVRPRSAALGRTFCQFRATGIKVTLLRIHRFGCSCRDDGLMRRNLALTHERLKRQSSSSSSSKQSDVPMLTARTAARKLLAHWPYRHTFQVSVKCKSALYDSDELRQKQYSLRWRLSCGGTCGGFRHQALH